MICNYTNSTIMMDCYTSNPHIMGFSIAIAIVFFIGFLILINYPTWKELAQNNNGQI